MARHPGRLLMQAPADIDSALGRPAPLERARILAGRKEVYERRHPETKHGAHLKLPPWQHWKEGASPLPERAPSFVEDSTASMPWSRRTIHRLVRIGSRIPPDLQTALAGTPIARRKTDLERIAGMKPDKQAQLLKRLRDAEQPPASLSALMTEGHRARRPPDNVEDLKRLWAKSSRAEREAIRAWITDQESCS